MAALELDVFFEGMGTPAGRLVRSDDGATSFSYLTDDLPHPLSLSMPVRTEPFSDSLTRSFFSNLLFENAQREQVMQRHGIDFSDVVGLLAHLGADCPGTISCVPVGSGPAKMPGDLEADYMPLTQEDLLRVMASLRDFRRVPDDTNDPSPLAGVQGKIALARRPDGSFALPRPGLNVPTTHILKVPRAAEMTTVNQEHLLMGIMAEVQRHPVAQTEIIGEGDLRGLLVERFDRIVEGNTVRRLHQEDFAQALGLGPQMKYQRNGTAERCFNADAIRKVLDQTAAPGRSRQAFLEITLANLLLGNTDNHAKNHALLYRGQRPDLAPVYDVAPVVIDDQVLHQLSFDIGTATMTDEVTSKDMHTFILALGFPRITTALIERLRTIVRHIVGKIPDMNGPERKQLGDAIAEQAKWIAPAVGEEINITERDLIFVNRP
ncbi:MAG: type II toxin-antitoxin system HipA family toxin [Rhodobacteraceae bacterium]|nr:type II toxin-antitoxin system HipA family toxin [Paracoccaceae bacterium]